MGNIHNKTFNNKSILVIEDSPFDQMLLKNLLVKHGFIVNIAKDGVSALDKLLVQKFDLIITDMYLPNLPGMEVAERIRNTDNHNRQIPIIAITGEEYEEAMIDIIKMMGINSYMMKPYDEIQIVEMIKNLLQSSINEPLPPITN